MPTIEEITDNTQIENTEIENTEIENTEIENTSHDVQNELDYFAKAIYKELKDNLIQIRRGRPDNRVPSKSEDYHYFSTQTFSYKNY